MRDANGLNHLRHGDTAMTETFYRRWSGGAAWRRAFFLLFVAVLAYPFVAFAVLGLPEALGIPASHMISMG